MKKGFTLIELLVVVAIISLLSSIVITSLGTARAKARVTRTAVELRQMVQAAIRYNLDTNTVPPRDLLNSSDTCERSVFITGEFEVDFPVDNVAPYSSRPSGWSGPYMSQWPPTLYGSEVRYGWDFFGCNDTAPPFGGVGGICESTGGSDRYILGLSQIPPSALDELLALHDLLDPDANPGDDASIAWLTQGCPTCTITFRYSPFSGLLPKQDPTLLSAQYPRAVNCNS